MQKHPLTIPELLFIIGTRAMLAGGVALLVSSRLTKKQRKAIGATLLSVGVVTTVPAAMIVMGTHDRAPEKIEP